MVGTMRAAVVEMKSESSKKVRIQYYALLREESGRSEETLTTMAHTTLDLFNELKLRYQFSLDSNRLSVAINDEFASWDHALSEDDTVVFIPPVAGG
jgi:molybdopterin converting factor small subunit